MKTKTKAKTKKKKKAGLRDDYDSPWKDILGIYFEEFMRFFFPYDCKKRLPT